MDSFYDEPRSAPVPLAFKEVFRKPVVSSPSIILNSNISNQQLGPTTSTNNAYSYEFWKQNQDKSTHNKSYNKPLDSGDKVYGQKLFNNNSFRKQVRFESPPLHTAFTHHRIKRPPDVQQSFPSSKLNDCLNYSQKNIDPKRHPLNLVPSKPFEEIYMANIPSRNLDLSMVDSNKSYLNQGGCDIENLNPLYEKTGVVTQPLHLNKRAGFTNCNRKVLEGLNGNAIKNNEKFRAKSGKITTENFNDQIRDVDEVVVDLYNYKYENFKKNSGVHLKCDYDTMIKRTSEQQNFSSTDLVINKMDQSIQTPETAVCITENKDSDSDEPTVKDLLQIMKQQNEQLLLLQKQVAVLLENKEKREQIEAPPALKEIAAPPFQNNPQILPHKNVINTHALFQNPNKYSIDVMTSFEVSIRPQVKNNKFFKEPKIQEITESENNFSNNKNNRKEDLKNTDLSLALNEPLKVPEQSHSPDNSIHVEMQDYSSDSDDENPVNVGWTLYDNIVGQVNQVLKKTGKNEDYRDKKCNPLQAVKEATINHLKTMGINVPIENLDDVNSGCDSNNSSNSSCSPTEISFAVKQLLMKYMPDEQLAKVATQNSQGNFGNRRPDFSFATLQYMQKYNLLAKDSIPKQMRSPVKTNANKILDITALKQQPKLM